MDKKNDKIKIKADFEDVIKLAVNNGKAKKKKTPKKKVSEKNKN